MEDAAPQPQLTKWLVTLFAFCCGAIVANIYYAQPIIALIAPELGLSERVASLIVSVTQVGYGLGLLFLVPLGDVLENKRLILITVLLGVVSLVAAASAQTASIFLLVSLLIGICSVSVQMLIPLAAHLSPDAVRGRVVGNIMGGLMAGILLARPISSLIADHFGWRAVFWSAAVLMASLIVLLAVVLPKREASHKANYPQLLHSLGGLFRSQPVLRHRAFLQACMFAAFSLFWTAVPLELTHYYGLSQSQIALFALVGATGAIAAPISGRLADKGYSRPATFWALAIGGLVFLSTVSSHAVGIIGLALAGVVLDFCVQMNMVLGQREVYNLDAASRSRLNALYMASIFAGGAIGSALASVLYSHWGWAGISVAGALLPLIALTAAIYPSKGHRAAAHR